MCVKLLYKIDRLKAENSSTITAVVTTVLARFVFEAVKCPVSNILTHNEEGGKNTLKNVENKELVYRVLELTLIRSTNEYLYH